MDRTTYEQLDRIDLGTKGDGIAKHDNFVIIIPATEVGKTYKIQIRKVFEKYAVGEVLEEVKDENTKLAYN